MDSFKIKNKFFWIFPENIGDFKKRAVRILKVLTNLRNSSGIKPTLKISNFQSFLKYKNQF